jgi:hypothetical protein
MSDNDIQLLTLGVMLVMQLIVLVMGFFMYRSIPQTAIQQLLDAAEKTANRTPSLMDDEAVKVARSLAALLQALNQSPVAPVAPEAEAQDVKKK